MTALIVIAVVLTLLNILACVLPEVPESVEVEEQELGNQTRGT